VTIVPTPLATAIAAFIRAAAVTSAAMGWAVGAGQVGQAGAAAESDMPQR
jgi:hypothetical protein